MSTLRELQASIDDGAVVERKVEGLRPVFVDKWFGVYQYHADEVLMPSVTSFDMLIERIGDDDGWKVSAAPNLLEEQLAEYPHLRWAYKGWCEAWRIQCLAGEWKA